MSAVPQRPMLDTNVLLDALLHRQPHADASNQVLLVLDNAAARSALCATTLTNFDYVARKVVGKQTVLDCLAEFLRLYDIAPVDAAVLREALASGFTDFEDAVLHAAAVAAGCDAIITRDISGFRKAKLPIYTPGEYLALLVTLNGTM